MSELTYLILLNCYLLYVKFCAYFSITTGLLSNINNSREIDTLESGRADEIKKYELNFYSYNYCKCYGNYYNYNNNMDDNAETFI